MRTVFVAILAAACVTAASAALAAAPLRDGGFALPPVSFTKFCVDYPSECPTAAGAAQVHMTGGRLAELSSVNRAVNASIVPTPDRSQFRFWRLNVTAGDCNNYAIQKRHELIERGWPAAALSLAVVETTWGEGHLVVTVRTDRGDLVLDNLRSTIVAWQRTGYRWVMRQSERNPQYWVALEGGRPGGAYSHDAGVEVADAEEASETDAEPAPAALPRPPNCPDHAAARAALAAELATAKSEFADATQALVAAATPVIVASWTAVAAFGGAPDEAMVAADPITVDAAATSPSASAAPSALVDPSFYGFL